MVSKTWKAIFLSEGGKRTCVSLASNGSWESHQKKSGYLLVNHDLGDQLKIVLRSFEDLVCHVHLQKIITLENKSFFE